MKVEVEFSLSLMVLGLNVINDASFALFDIHYSVNTGVSQAAILTRTNQIDPRMLE